jgi:UDP-glucose 4-epimerase
MRILVIGSKGFIGTHLVNYYQRQDRVEVWGCDVVTDYPAKNYFLIDASNSDFNEVFQTQSFDACINCSGSASVPASMQNPSRDYHLNVLNVFNILEAIRRYSPNCKFLNLSSAAVYGNPQNLPVREEAVSNPLSPYGWHKLYSELLCKEFNQNFGIQTCSLRIFSAFGVGLQKQLFWDWHQKALSSNKLLVYGTGEESRDFIYIYDLVNAIACVLANGNFEAGIYNIGNGIEVFIKDVIRAFQEHHHTSFEYEFSNKTRAGDPINWVADVEKLKSLGYKQTISFEDGVKDYCKWLREKE